MENTIGERISLIIDKSQVKKVQFAERIGVHQTYVSQMVSDKKVPSDRVIRDICEEFSVNENWLRTGEGGPDNMFVKPSSDSQAIAARVAKEYGSDPLLKAIMTTYLQLDDAKRALLLEIVEGFSVALKDAMTTGKPAPDVSEYIRSRPDVIDAARATRPHPADQSQSS